MTIDELEIVEGAIANVASVIAERRRQASQGATGPFPFFNDALAREARRLHLAGQDQLSDAITALTAEIGELANG